MALLSIAANYPYSLTTLCDNLNSDTTGIESTKYLRITIDKYLQ